MGKKPVLRDHYEEIRQQLEEATKKYVYFKPWHPREDQLLKEFHTRLPVREFARQLGRSESQVYNRLGILGLTKGHTNSGMVLSKESLKKRRKRAE